MLLTEEKIKTIFSQKDFTRGKAYFQGGRIHDLRVTMSNHCKTILCTVEGTDDYQVSIKIAKNSLHSRCTCPRFEDTGACKHVVAAMLAYAASAQNNGHVESDFHARRLLDSYLSKFRRNGLCSGEAHLVPRILPSRSGYPLFSFQVGFDRLYVVRDIREFLDNVADQRTTTYGKGLTLYHGLEQFDPLSQSLITVLMDQLLPFRSSFGNNFGGQGSLWNCIRDKNMIFLTGSAFDRWFDLLLGRTVELASIKGGIAFSEQTPNVSLRLKRGGKTAVLEVQIDKAWSFFGSTQSLYALNEKDLVRCDDAFRQKVEPLLQRGVSKMQIAYSDLPTFCSCVLPAIQDIVDIQDPDNLLQEYLPDECVPCFYFDIEDDILKLRLAFRYGDTAFDWNQTPAAPVKRDVLAEESTQRLVSQYFQSSPQEGFYLSEDDAIFEFLTEHMESFHKCGDVFATDRLRLRRVQPSAASVGISVSGGLLSLDIDTGGFPPEELEALYQSLLKKRRYYRLKDGRYLPLDGSSCETLAEMSHMLQLSPKELTEGTVTLPAFRGLYLDSLLSDRTGVQVHRDQQFRSMIRNFKSVAESDYSLPPELEGVLRPYQKVGFQWLKTLENCGFGGILADEMGLGKTVQVIAFLRTASRETVGLPSLVICPASLILNWMDEFTKFAPALNVALIMGTVAERARLIAGSGEADVWVTSYELLRQDIAKYQELDFYCCVLDEGQHIKNQSTLASKAVKQISCRQRFVLTGTPVENRLSELWNLFDFLMPGYLFSHRGFVEKLEKPVVKSGNQEAADQLRRLVQPFLLRRLKKDVLKDLPPKSEYVQKIALSEEERKVYLASAAAAKRSLTAAGDQGKLAILAALTQLRQICCAPELCFENYQGPDSKLEAALELCAGMVENGHQILLFSQFTSMLSRIRARLDELKISHFTLQGSTPKEKRAQLVRAFNAGEASVFLISLKAGGTGLNLTAADVVIHYDPWWNIAAQNQATDRAHRIGQQAHVQVYKLIAKDTIEERILELQSKKAALMDAISDGSGESILNMSKEDLLALLE